MRIRSASRTDITVIDALLRSSPGVWQPSWRDDAVERALLSANGLAYVAEENGAVVGFACAHDTGFRAYLSEMVIAESWQRRGVGAALLGALQQGIAQRGCKLVVADIYPPAAAFYRALGWAEPRATLLCRDIVADNAA
jgi:ribosomal protein S18 acetylase RimI-like enzyme